MYVICIAFKLNRNSWAFIFPSISNLYKTEHKKVNSFHYVLVPLRMHVFLWAHVPNTYKDIVALPLPYPTGEVSYGQRSHQSYTLFQTWGHTWHALVHAVKGIHMRLFIRVPFGIEEEYFWFIFLPGECSFSMSDRIIMYYLYRLPPPVITIYSNYDSTRQLCIQRVWIFSLNVCTDYFAKQQLLLFS